MFGSGGERERGLRHIYRISINQKLPWPAIPQIAAANFSNTTMNNYDCMSLFCLTQAGALND